MSNTIHEYLDLLDSQRESVFRLLSGVSDDKLWHRPLPKEWSIGEILDHNYLLIGSIFPVVKWSWRVGAWYGWFRRKRSYQTDIKDLYRDPKFLHWVGFLWTPRQNVRKPVPLDILTSEIRVLHHKVRRFYENKPEDVLGNLYLYDPLFGWCNLIVTLRIGIYHDQLHFDDVLKQIELMRMT